jgi:hypothetical protein
MNCATELSKGLAVFWHLAFGSFFGHWGRFGFGKGILVQCMHGKADACTENLASKQEIILEK